MACGRLAAQAGVALEPGISANAAWTRRPHLHDAASAVIVACVTLAYSLSFALLIFSGPLSAGFDEGVTAALLGAGLCTLIIAACSSYPRAVGGPDSAPMAIMSVMALSLMAGAAALPQDALVAGIIGAMAVASAFTGALLLVLGLARLESLIRFIPYPVLAGFIAAVGWQLSVGGVRILAGDDVSLMDPQQWVTGDTPYQLAAGGAIALVIAIEARFVRWRFGLPFILVVAVLGVHVALWMAGIGHDESVLRGWFVGLVHDTASASAQPIGLLNLLAQMDVDFILGGAGEIAACAVITAANVLLNGTSLELWTRRSIDLNRELRVNGLANIASALAAGMPGNLSFNRTMLNARSGAHSRYAGIGAGLLCLILPFTGLGFVAWAPLPVLGGLLVFLGVSVMAGVLDRARRNLGLIDYVFVAGLLILIVQFGYLEGVGLGILASCVLFVWRYSHVDVVRHDLTRASFASMLDRPRHDNELLRAHGATIHILWLRGYLFFGTASRLFAAIEKRVLDDGPGRLRHLALDFSRVSGLDSSAVFSFVKLRNLAADHNVSIAMCAMPHALRASFRGEGLLRSGETHVSAFDTLDRGIEWCEERLLAALRPARNGTHAGFEAWLQEGLGTHASAARLMAKTKAITLAPGDRLFAQGDTADALYFIEDGKLDIVMRAEDGTSVRLRSMARQTVVGEMGLYRSMDRTASVIAAEPSRAHELSRAAFEQIAAEDPPLADAIHRMIARIMADRLSFANATVAALQ